MILWRRRNKLPPSRGAECREVQASRKNHTGGWPPQTADQRCKRGFPAARVALDEDAISALGGETATFEHRFDPASVRKHHIAHGKDFRSRCRSGCAFDR